MPDTFDDPKAMLHKLLESDLDATDILIQLVEDLHLSGVHVVGYLETIAARAGIAIDEKGDTGDGGAEFGSYD